MKFKVTVAHKSTSTSVGYIEADSADAARKLALTADWSGWHTEDEVDEDYVVAVVKQSEP